MRSKSISYYEQLIESYEPLDSWKKKIAKAATYVRRKKTQAHYASVNERTDIPVAVIAAIHMREGRSWSAGLHNGQRWDQITTQVPIGVGPFTSWEEAAIDAIIRKTYLFPRNGHWSLARIAAFLEAYNGLGYQMYHDVDSPYLWNGSTHGLDTGKYGSDGNYSASLVDRQVGAMCLVLELSNQESSLTKRVMPEDTKSQPLIAYSKQGDESLSTKEEIRNYQRFLNTTWSSIKGVDDLLKVDGLIGPATALAHYKIFGTHLIGDPNA